jgi:hypothetical protein
MISQDEHGRNVYRAPSALHVIAGIQYEQTLRSVRSERGILHRRNGAIAFDAAVVHEAEVNGVQVLEVTAGAQTYRATLHTLYRRGKVTYPPSLGAQWQLDLKHWTTGDLTPELPKRQTQPAPQLALFDEVFG